MRLPPVAATALAAAIVAGISVLAFAWIPALLLWAAFIGWACYDQSGADPQAWLRSSAGLVFGVVMAGAVAIIVASNALPVAVSVATAVCAAIASFLIVTGSAVLTQGAVAAAFYGFASTFAFVGLAPGASTIGAMTSLSARNALLVVPLSLLIGTCWACCMDAWRRCSPPAARAACFGDPFGSTGQRCHVATIEKRGRYGTPPNCMNGSGPGCVAGLADRQRGASWSIPFWLRWFRCFQSWFSVTSRA
jgi:hypothetical protein